ncbi:hypothetical protein QT711_11740 [Sporosarcina saromensis]|uniref:Uncharacterized protein n=1 Tax=Sporosarcina saromensis TaxID=359365 RepID=A0ABU4GAC6_9BACL|nr:hypothetical protein [Sporosarcina saromensis]MDW0113861.1 hypothetical protein [Sporosarcina saromensis]
MKKIKVLSLSLIAALCLGLSAPFSSVQASDNVNAQITPMADRIFVEQLKAPTYTSAIWVTEVRNGKTYSGYLYNRGFHPTNGYSIFNGWLDAAPYVDPYLLEDN